MKAKVASIGLLALAACWFARRPMLAEIDLDSMLARAIEDTRRIGYVAPGYYPYGTYCSYSRSAPIGIVPLRYVSY